MILHLNYLSQLINYYLYIYVHLLLVAINLYKTNNMFVIEKSL